jgi:hypothetical protein
MLLRGLRFLTIMLGALSLSLNVAHLLELPQRMKFDRDLWVRVTVVEEVYRLFGSVGAVFEIGAIVAACALAFVVRGRGAASRLALGGAACLALAFGSWLTFVAPANAEFARWLTGPIPPDWARWRDQWEYTHAINTAIKAAGLSLLVLSALVEGSRTAAVRSGRG